MSVFDGVVDKEFVLDGLGWDGEHHKVWFMEKMAAALGFPIEHMYQEALKDEEYGAWERGIPP